MESTQLNATATAADVKDNSEDDEGKPALYRMTEYNHCEYSCFRRFNRR